MTSTVEIGAVRWLASFEQAQGEAVGSASGVATAAAVGADRNQPDYGALISLSGDVRTEITLEGNVQQVITLTGSPECGLKRGLAAEGYLAVQQRQACLV